MKVFAQRLPLNITLRAFVPYLMQMPKNKLKGRNSSINKSERWLMNAELPRQSVLSAASGTQRRSYHQYQAELAE